MVKEINPSFNTDDMVDSDSLLERGLDSLDHASLLLQIEEEFGCKFPDEEIEEIVSIDKIAGFLEKSGKL